MTSLKPYVMNNLERTKSKKFQLLDCIGYQLVLGICILSLTEKINFILLFTSICHDILEHMITRKLHPQAKILACIKSVTKLSQEFLYIFLLLTTIQIITSFCSFIT
jgi:hypothetical protein